MVWVSDWGWKVWGLNWIGWIRRNIPGILPATSKSTSGREQIQKRKNGGFNIPLGLWVRLIGLEARVQTRKDLGWERQGLCSKVNLHVNKVLQSCIVTFIFHLFTPECSPSLISLVYTYLILFWTLRCDTLFYSYLKTPGCGKAMKRIEALLANLAGWQH